LKENRTPIGFKSKKMKPRITRITRIETGALPQTPNLHFLCGAAADFPIREIRVIRGYY